MSEVCGDPIAVLGTESKRFSPSWYGLGLRLDPDRAACDEMVVLFALVVGSVRGWHSLDASLLETIVLDGRSWVASPVEVPFSHSLLVT